MEWVETTAKSLDEAKNAALDELGVAADEAEFDVLDEPKQGLFGRTRGEARVRARVKPAQVRPKNERRRKSTKDRASSKNDEATAPRSGDAVATAEIDRDTTPAESPSDERASNEQTSDEQSGRVAGRPRRSDTRRGNNRSQNQQERTMHDDDNESTVTPQEVGDAAVAFMDGLVAAFGATGTAELTIDDTELDVAVTGDELGLLVGPGGRTLNAIQDLARVSAQRRLGDHETRLRIDVAGYRVRRNEALARFAADVAAQVRDSGVARSLEPMSSADRKVIHDALTDEEGVSSRSEGDDPNRRVVVVPD